MLRSIAASLALPALYLLIAAGLGSPALAHGGDHSHLTVVELVTHLSSSLDHKAAIVVVGAALALIAISSLLVRSSGRGRRSTRF